MSQLIIHVDRAALRRNAEDFMNRPTIVIGTMDDPHKYSTYRADILSSEIKPLNTPLSCGASVVITTYSHVIMYDANDEWIGDVDPNKEEVQLYQSKFPLLGKVHEPESKNICR